MKWYENQVIIGAITLALVAIVAIVFQGDAAKDIAVPAATGIAGLVTGGVLKQ